MSESELPKSSVAAAGLQQGVFGLRVRPVVSAAHRQLLQLDIGPARWRGNDCLLAGTDYWVAAGNHACEQDLARSLLDELGRKSQGWLELFPDLGFSLVLPVAVLADEQVLLSLLEVLRQRRFPMDKLELRLRETELMRDVRAGFELAERIRQHGIDVAVGVFGAQYARYAELNALPFDALWLKEDFAPGTAQAAPAAEVLASAIALGRRHQLRVVAQGVSTPEQWQTLRTAGCSAIQGGLVGASMKDSEVAAWLQHVGGQSDAGEVDQDAEPGEGAAQAVRRALIVDDDPIVRSLLQHQLGMLGFARCVLAEDGRQAMERIKSREGFAAIFCDLKMPGMDGIEFLRHVAKWAPEVNIVLISSVDAKVMRSAASFARAHQLHLIGTLNKPVRLETLKAILLRLERQENSDDPVTHVAVTRDDLEHALANGQIQAHFQPQAEVGTGRLVGAESLVRWQHPRGLLMPAQFLSLAEESGQMRALTDQVIVQALQAQRLWRDQGLVLKVSVNLTMDVLSELDFPDRLSTLCSEHAVEAKYVILEITESGAMQNPAVTLDVVTRLRMRGFGLSIDDFGTGFSSLRQLREIPFNELKVDQSFVSIAHLDHEARKIVESNIRLASNLNMCSVAEGVETIDDWTLLRILGCDVLQGYFLSRAMPMQAFLEWAQGPYARKLDSGELPPE